MENSCEYTVERALSQIKSTQRTLLCEDLNAHYSWWNSKITQAKNAEKLTEWLEENHCELINTSDIFTFTRNRVNDQYSFTIDLTFVTRQLTAEIIDWQIKKNEYSDSDHEVIQFSVITENIELIESSFNAPFNIQKVNWSEFRQQLAQESTAILKNLQHTLSLKKATIDKIEDSACKVRDLIVKAAEDNISKRKPCSRSEVWWTENLTLLRKKMTKQNRIYKRHNQSQLQWEKFTICRTEYF